MSERTSQTLPAGEIIGAEPFEATLRRLQAASQPSPEEQARREAENARFARQQHATNVEELRRRWNAPARQVQCTPRLEGEWATTLDSMKSRLQSKTGFTVALVGTRGSGKTQIGVEAMKAVTEMEKPALFTTAMGFFMAVKEAYRKDAENSEILVMTKYRKPTLLVIDEIGKRGDTEWENNMLFELLNHRYNDMTATILIDNRAKVEFVATIGPSIASRMNEGGGIIECNWKSFRE